MPFIPEGLPYGGGICIATHNGVNTLPIITNNTISDNSAFAGGGIFCLNSCMPTIEDNIISNNYAEFGGGVCFLNQEAQTSADISRNLIFDNHAGDMGGGIYFCSGDLTIRNCTITGNTAQDYYGSQIKLYGGSSSVINSIVWGSTGSPENDISDAEGNCNITYSCIRANFAGTGNIYTDPLFIDADNENFHLLPDSPCIDTGNPDAQYNDPDGSRNDMGAYFFDNSFVVPGVPQNVEISIFTEEGNEVEITWTPVVDAVYYKIYSSDNPYYGFEEVTNGTFYGAAGNYWFAPLPENKKFYYVKAVK